MVPSAYCVIVFAAPEKATPMAKLVSLAGSVIVPSRHQHVAFGTLIGS